MQDEDVFYSDLLHGHVCLANYTTAVWEETSFSLEAVRMGLPLHNRFALYCTSRFSDMRRLRNGIIGDQYIYSHLWLLMEDLDKGRVKYHIIRG